MKTVAMTALSLILMVGVSVPAHAQLDLGGVLGGGGDSGGGLLGIGGSGGSGDSGSLLGIVGGSDSGALVTLGSGNAGNSGLVNVGLGGGNGQLVDANVGGSNSVVNANAGLGRGGTLVDANVGLLDGAVGVTTSVGGPGLIGLDVDLNLRGRPGTPGTPGAPGAPGAPGVNGNGNNGNNGSNGTIFANRGGGSGSFSAACAGTPTSQIQRLVNETRIDGSWQRASNVQVQRVDMCPEVKQWLASALNQTGMAGSLRSAVSSDALLNASLSRSSYSADRVFAVHRSGNQLTMFVY